ncbi:MAG: transketolase [Thermoprotei archaeon ex4572_64]|nr:MAG: transketolase [Thermoprotei archaeon ex4572_64]
MIFNTDKHDLASLTPRDALGRALVDLGEKYSDVVVVTADVGEATRAKYFQLKFPERYFNVGISEQDMIGVATGLALTGFKVYAVAFSMFLMRAWEQVRNSVARMNVPIKIIGTHAGFSDSHDGASHQCLEDLALMRVLPNLVIINPADACEVYEAVTASIGLKSPCYIRIGRDFSINITCNLDYKFEIGKAVIIQEGTDVSIFTTGQMLPFTVEAVKILEEKGISAELVHFHTIQPLDVSIIEKSARKTGAVVTIEEHLVRGGFGSAVAEVLVQTYPVPMSIMGATRFGHSAKNPLDLYKYFGLTSEEIAARAEELVKIMKRQ